MAVNIRELPKETNKIDQAFSSTGNFYTLQYEGAVHAIRTLDHALRTNQTNASVVFPRHQHRRFPYLLKSPSATDSFIFFTNMLPIDIEHVPFNISIDFDRGTNRNLPHGPNYKHFSSHSTLAAVDSDLVTCWKPNRSMNQGDYFGVDLLRIKTNSRILLVVRNLSILLDHIDLRISLDGMVWTSCQPSTDCPIERVDSSFNSFNGYLVDAMRFPPAFQSFRYIAFNCTYASAKIFEVCDVRMIGT
jgi:hypothetical protein